MEARIGVHKLPSEWKFWVIQLKWGGKTKQYEIEPIFSFNTVEEFWNNFIQFPSITELKKGGLSLFKSDIKPAWEDPKNKGGQAVNINLTSWTQQIWENLILTIIGGELEDTIKSAPFCGVYSKVNTVGFSCALWFGPGTIDLTALANLLKLDPSLLSVKAHPK